MPGIHEVHGRLTFSRYLNSHMPGVHDVRGRLKFSRYLNHTLMEYMRFVVG